MRITCKLPMAEELATALCAMSDADAGAAFKAALVYLAGREVPALPPGASLAFAAMQELIDISRMKAAAGRAGGNAEHFSGRKSSEKQTFAGSTAGSTVANSAESRQANPPQSPDQIDVLAGLEAFL